MGRQREQSRLEPSFPCRRIQRRPPVHPPVRMECTDGRAIFVDNSKGDEPGAGRDGVGRVWAESGLTPAFLLGDATSVKVPSAPWLVLPSSITKTAVTTRADTRRTGREMAEVFLDVGPVQLRDVLSVWQSGCPQG